MPPFDPVTLALGGASMLPQLYAAFSQNAKADKLRLLNTSTAGEQEQLAMSRQLANSGQMPGQAAAETRLGQVQAGAVQNATLGAASSGDFLAAAGAANTQRQQGAQQLTTQAQQFQQQNQQQLRRDLTTQSQRQQRDLDTYNQNKAALIQGSATNLNNAVQTGTSFAAQAYNMGAFGNHSVSPNSTLGSDGQNALGTMYNDPTGGYYPGISNMGFGRFQRQANMGINFGG